MYEGALPYGYFTDGKSRWDATGFDTVTPPAASLLLISLDEAKKQLRLATSETYHETSLYSFIKSQTSLAESHSWLQFFRGTFITYMPVFTSIIRIWKNPVIAINSIKYYDQDNTLLPKFYP